MSHANVLEIVDAQKEAFLSVLSSEQIVWEKECRFAHQALMQNRYLNEVAWANQDSLRNAIINIGSIGISLNPVLKHAYLVPRKVDGVARVCLDISYQGLLDLAMSTGEIVWAQAKIVYMKDLYENMGIDKAPNHTYQAFGDRGEIKGVYCTVKLKGGDYLTEEMDKATLDHIRSKAAANGPWKEWFDEMSRKSVIKRAYKLWPKNDRMTFATDMLNREEGNVMPIYETEQSSSHSTTLTELLASDNNNLVLIENKILGAATEDDLNALIPEMRMLEEGKDKEKIRVLWSQIRSELKGVTHVQGH